MLDSLLLFIPALFAARAQEQPVQLKEYLESRIDGLQAMLETRLDAADKAIELSAANLTIRINHNNEADAEARRKEDAFAKKDETENIKASMEALKDSLRLSIQAAEESLDARIAALEQERSKSEGKLKGGEPLSAIWMMVVASVVAIVVGMIFANRTKALEEKRTRRETQP